MGGSLIARDEIGNEVLVTDWVKTYLAGSKSLVQGLKVGPVFQFAPRFGSPRLTQD